MAWTIEIFPEILHSLLVQSSLLVQGDDIQHNETFKAQLYDIMYFDAFK